MAGEPSTSRPQYSSCSTQTDTQIARGQAEPVVDQQGGGGARDKTRNKLHDTHTQGRTNQTPAGDTVSRGMTQSRRVDNLRTAVTHQRVFTAHFCTNKPSQTVTNTAQLPHTRRRPAGGDHVLCTRVSPLFRQIPGVRTPHRAGSSPLQRTVQTVWPLPVRVAPGYDTSSTVQQHSRGGRGDGKSCTGQCKGHRVCGRL